MEDNQTKNKNLRLLEHFLSVEESTFWPREISEVMSAMNKEISFKELDAILEQAFIAKMNDVERNSKQYKQDYDTCLDDLHKLKNTFSYDIDFI